MSAQDHDTESSTAGYVFFMTMLFFLFMVSLQQLLFLFQVFVAYSSIALANSALLRLL